MSTPPTIPQPLLRFPVEVREAYQTFRSSRDEEALKQVIFAAVLDFMPKNSAHPRAEPLRGGHRLIEDLGFDSLAVAETVFFFEDLFQVTIRNEEIMALRTVGELGDFVALRLRGKTPSS